MFGPFLRTRALNSNQARDLVPPLVDEHPFFIINTRGRGCPPLGAPPPRWGPVGGEMWIVPNTGGGNRVEEGGFRFVRKWAI